MICYNFFGVKGKVLNFDRIKTFGKIETVNKAFLFWNWQRLKISFFRNKTFLFFKIESWNFQVQFEIEFRETSQNFNSIRQPIKKDENNNCLNKLNELKFCEVSQNSISNWTWKFQLSILKNKKVLFLKKKFFKPLSISKQKSFVYWLNFSEGFVFFYMKNSITFGGYGDFLRIIVTNINYACTVSMMVYILEGILYVSLL